MRCREIGEGSKRERGVDRMLVIISRLKVDHLLVR